jgi:hypothetical protein
MMSPTVIASEAKQSIAPQKERMDCFVATAPRNDGYDDSLSLYRGAAR